MAVMVNGIKIRCEEYQRGHAQETELQSDVEDIVRVEHKYQECGEQQRVPGRVFALDKQAGYHYRHHTGGAHRGRR